MIRTVPLFMLQYAQYTVQQNKVSWLWIRTLYKAVKLYLKFPAAVSWSMSLYEDILPIFFTFS